MGGSARNILNGLRTTGYLQTKNRDAVTVVRTSGNRVTLIEVKPHEERYQRLSNLIHQTFVSNVPAGFAKRPDIVYWSRSTVRELAKNGGPAYDAMIETVKFAYRSPTEYRECHKALNPPVTK